jgi:hypothetical protein
MLPQGARGQNFSVAATGPDVFLCNAAGDGRGVHFYLSRQS